MNTESTPSYCIHTSHHIIGFFGKFRFLSNFYLAAVELDGQTFRCVESAFQAAKLTDLEKRKQFQCLLPAQAKSLGRKVALRADWESVKGAIMLTCLRSKFAKDAVLASALLDTGDADLEERNSWGDREWGTSLNGDGKNKLGLSLMQVRRELAAASKTILK